MRSRTGKIDAFFWVGGLPTAAITDLASSAGREDQAGRPCRPGAGDEQEITAISTCRT